ncbi:NAD(P)/FAD-dependent oxidoreductase [Roseofilum casamattae]|uniref:NAD(P)/FAD-dependent oxidoreductase n=1 Tax=Roseofilum casamattae BLCC-M143 TaxID=3022442 RepID=A0ABT7C1F5_9CYAN|nr:NAD(P)/FAD-dependent oxidoreductase [Roseofilum casamattae]MDJ1184579.1 NAD(P)/FAD-dependent oxidoreductase [Roseofilum casamattae BLCC-M143]
MAVDYDLIILGASPGGIEAAAIAARQGARVGLIVPSSSKSEWVWGYRPGHWFAMSQILQQVRDRPELPPVSRPQSYPEIAEWIAVAINTLNALNSPAALAELGVDIIDEWGEFQRHEGRLAIALQNRRLVASSYLLALETDPRVEIDGLAEAGYLVPDRLLELKELPEEIAIIGSDPRGVEFAQLLQQLGTKVTLITPESRLLPLEEPEADRALHIRLQGMGVTILTETEVSQARKIDRQTWLQIDSRAIAVDRVLLVTPGPLPLDRATLEFLGMACSDRGILVNDKLQTTNPLIYACGDSIGGYSLPHLTRYEANIAVQNALLIPIFPMRYNSFAYTIYTDPALARVGLTEAGARSRYGHKIRVITLSMQEIPGAIVLGEIAGFMKVVLRENGIVLGATVLGARAEEIIHTLSLAIANEIKLQDFQHSPGCLGSISEGLSQLCDRWNQMRWERSFWSPSLLKWWLSWVKC